MSGGPWLCAGGAAAASNYSCPPPPGGCRHSSAPENIQKAHDAAFKALNEAYQALMDGDHGAGLCVRRFPRPAQASSAA